MMRLLLKYSSPFFYFNPAKLEVVGWEEASSALVAEALFHLG